jgi:hypothetical protein
MADLDIVEHKLRIIPGQNSLKTTETLEPETCQALEAWLAIKTKSEYLLPQHLTRAHASTGGRFTTSS